MARAFFLVMDSFGVGAAPDAEAFGDVGANTLGHIADWCADGNTSPFRPKAGPLSLPTLSRLGLGRAAALASGSTPKGLDMEVDPIGLYGACAEQSAGKDTPSGHWEMAGVPVLFDWGYFPKTVPTFPSELTDALIERCDLPGLLGNKHASGTDIIKELGDEHCESGKPIVYTSADSVFQIAAHEKDFGLERLYKVCAVARELVDDYAIGRVIARPFVGERGTYKRTGNRRDLAVPPPEPTLLEKLNEQGRAVISIGKIADIFANQGVTLKIKATGNDALFMATEDQLAAAPDGALVFTNFVDFDQEYGHRRNPGGYAAALERFDQQLATLLPNLLPDDLVVLTADHGCDPTWPGTDHTREYVPFLAFGKAYQPASLGLRDSFADMGQTIASHLDIPPLNAGIAAF